MSSGMPWHKISRCIATSLWSSTSSNPCPVYFSSVSYLTCPCTDFPG